MLMEIWEDDELDVIWIGGFWGYVLCGGDVGMGISWFFGVGVLWCWLFGIRDGCFYCCGFGVWECVGYLVECLGGYCCLCVWCC